MKILAIRNGFLQLPDDFNGTLPDALKLLADRIEKATADGSIAIEEPVPDDYVEMFGKFWELIHRPDGKYKSLIGCCIAEQVGDRMITIPLKLGTAINS